MYKLLLSRKTTFFSAALVELQRKKRWDAKKAEAKKSKAVDRTSDGEAAAVVADADTSADAAAEKLIYEEEEKRILVAKQVRKLS